MLDIKEDKCTGCQQCKAVCPKDAISYIMKNGFRYPLIDKTKCIGCSKCEKYCPAINNSQNSNKKAKVFSAWCIDDEKRVECTSGGVCYELAKYVVSLNGYVAGVSWDETYKKAKYELINSIEGLQRITQTKYFQPEMNDIYSKVKGQLENSVPVLFIGTACCCDALKRYLQKDYENLLVCDFICRGYTSQIYHEKWVEYLEKKYDSKVKHVQYKNKKLGWEHFGTLVQFENGKELYVNREDDPYEILFQIDDYNTRPSCYACKYRTNVRLSDITVGDFWGIKGQEKVNLYNGISAVIINNEKGQELFDKIKNNLHIERKDLYELRRGNPALMNSFQKKEGADVFFSDMNELDWEEFINKYTLRKRGHVMMRQLKRLKEFWSCDWILFFYLNFMCKNVKRGKGKYIVPYRGTRINMTSSSQIIISENLYLNATKHKGGHEETFVTMYKDSKWIVKGRTRVSNTNTIDIMENAELVNGEMTTNIGCVIVCAKRIEMGDDVQMGRNVTIYDSSHHATNMSNVNRTKPLRIGNHVWLCTGVTITKGIKIGSGAVCAIDSTVISNVGENNMVMGNPAKTIMTDIEW